MHLLYLDESGSHGLVGENRAYVLAGVAVHEADAGPLQAALTSVVSDALPSFASGDEPELHAAEIFRPRNHEDSPWRAVRDHRVRQAVLQRALETLGSFGTTNGHRPPALFAAIANPADPEAQRCSYEVVLNRFDDYLTRIGERGIAISDVAHNDNEERRLQSLSNGWRAVATAAGQLDRMCDVLFFSDSRASRLLQAADLVAWATWRKFGYYRGDSRWLEPLMGRFESLEKLV